MLPAPAFESTQHPVYLPVHDFPEVARISLGYESEQEAVYSPADARVT